MKGLLFVLLDRIQRVELGCWTCGCKGHGAWNCPDRKEPNGTHREGQRYNASGGGDADSGANANNAEACHADAYTATKWLVLPEPPSDPVTQSLSAVPEAFAATADEPILCDGCCNMSITPRRDLLHEYIALPHGFQRVSGMAQGSSSVVGMGTLVLRYGKRTLRVPGVGHIVNARRCWQAGSCCRRTAGIHERTRKLCLRGYMMQTNSSSSRLTTSTTCRSCALWQCQRWQRQRTPAASCGMRAWHTPTSRRCARCNSPRWCGKRAAGEMMHYDIAFPAALGRKGEHCLLTVFLSFFFLFFLFFSFA